MASGRQNAVEEAGMASGGWDTVEESKMASGRRDTVEKAALASGGLDAVEESKMSSGGRNAVEEVEMTSGGFEEHLLVGSTKSTPKTESYPNLKDAACLTDLCCSSELAEVEIVSLLEEKIPKYKLRVDSITSFSGYENADFGVPYPALSPSEYDLGLSPDMMRETFNYMCKY
ncbi:hypothetical protein B566_EDAN016601 [Ephemera danica]|nr:hypothetical protein B566_EDAN016601 [Ephemera danica]